MHIPFAVIVVARVRMSKMTGPAYGAAIRAFVECCNKENGGNLIDKLKGSGLVKCTNQRHQVCIWRGKGRGTVTWLPGIILVMGI